MDIQTDMSEAGSEAGHDGYALSPEQQVVLADPLLRDHPAVFSATLNGPWRDADLRRACEQVLARHESLRTVFRQTPGYALPRQYPLEGAVARMETIEAHQAAPDELARLEHDAVRLDAGRLVRCVLLRHGADGSHARFVLSAARLVADEAGLASLYRDVLDAYGRLRRDEPASEIDEGTETIQYTQFVEWRAELALGDEAADGAAYWTRYLERIAADGAQAPSLPCRQLPARGAGASAQRSDATEAATDTFLHGRSVCCNVDGTLDAAAHSCGVTPAVLAQAAWWLLLARIAGEERVLGAWQHDCRDGAPMLEGSIGAFVRTYPVTLDCPAARPFAEVAQEFGALLEAHTRWLEYWPANPAAFDRPLPAFDEIGFAAAGVVPDWTFEDGTVRLSAKADRCRAVLPGYGMALQIDVDAAGSPRVATLYFSGERYAEPDMTVLLRQYTTLLASIAADVNAPVGDFALDGREQQKRLLAWQGEARDWGARTLPAAIAAWATITPEAPALAASDLSLSYAQLEARVAGAAALLRANGVGRGSVVGLLLPRSATLIVALLATMRAGAAYLPLDPAWPAARRDEIVAQAGVRIVLCERGADTAPGHIAFDALDALNDRRDFDAPAGGADADVLAKPSVDDDAYVLYTSGSTGTPKGVVIGHRQLMNYVAGSSEALGLRRCRRFALTSTVAADLGNTTLFGALYNGACLVVAQADDMKDAQSFAAFVQSNRIDCLKITPSHLGALLDTAAPCVPDLVVLGGEPVPVDLAARLAQLNPAAKLFNHYGPTETTVGVLVHEYREPGARAAGASSLPLSVPLPNCRACVLDSKMRLVPLGATGELYLGGAQLSRGYLAHAGGDVFVDDPFNPGERLYRSGDRARYLAGGGIQLVGRADAQVKIRGFRVEPAEIEAELLRAPEVREAAVRVWGDDPGRQLAAYVVSGAPAADGARLREWLAQRLPDAMVPSHLMVLRELPRLANGKIDRRALPDPREGSTAQASRPPRTALETLLMHLASELLGKAISGIDINLFDAGADSLVAIRLVSRIRELLRTEALPGLVFTHPSVERLAGALRDSEPSAGELERIARLRLRLESMSPEQRERLAELARERSRTSGSEVQDT